MAGSFEPAARLTEQQATEIRGLYEKAHTLDRSGISTLRNWSNFEFSQKNYPKSVELLDRLLIDSMTPLPTLTRKAYFLSSMNSQNQPEMTLRVILQALSHASETTSGQIALDEQFSIETAVELIGSQKELFRKMTIPECHELVRAIGRTAENLDSKSGRSSGLAELAFQLLELEVNRLEQQQGYGMDIVTIKDRAFQYLKKVDPTRFEKLVERHKALPTAAPYTGIL